MTTIVSMPGPPLMNDRGVLHVVVAVVAAAAEEAREVRDLVRVVGVLLEDEERLEQEAVVAGAAVQIQHAAVVVDLEVVVLAVAEDEEVGAVLPFVMFAVSATGTPSGYSSVRLPVSGIVGTVPMTIESSPPPRSIIVATAVSFESTVSLPPSRYISTRSTCRKVIDGVRDAFAWMIPTRKSPLPAAFSAMLSAWFVPKTTRSSAPRPPPVSAISICAWLPSPIVIT